MVLNVITLFPEFFNSPLDVSILKRAIEKKLITVNLFNLREFTESKHKKCDAYSYGGGPGMVLSPEPVYNAVKFVKKKHRGSKVIFFTPSGKRFTNKLAKELSKQKSFILFCGHYEDIDSRAVSLLADEEISIGDYIITGGEAAALIFIDAISRLQKGVLLNNDSIKDESFENGLLRYEQYTRPEVFKGIKVPQVLLSGNHKKVREWRRLNSILKTVKRRPDLLADSKLSEEDKKLLNKVLEENSG